jgi:hypothetical protein
MTGESKNDPKIFVDEDWKSQVQAEKEAAAKKEAEQPAGPEAPASEKPAEAAAQQTMPPPSLAALVTMFATQVMMSLGQIPDPLTGKTEKRPEAAKYYIDMLDMIEKKTQGNRTDDESKILENVLHELRMMYVGAGG